MKNIFLMDTHIAGTSHIYRIKNKAANVKRGDRLIMTREPDNEYDDNAIVIRDRSGVKLGYVPMKENEILARLMDGGKILFARVLHKKILGTWHKIDIRIFMQE